MSKQADDKRILAILSETDGLSNQRIKVALNLSDERYSTVRDKLLEQKKIEKYMCRGGGIRATKNAYRIIAGKSKVAKESALYEPFCESLRKIALEDEEIAIVLNTSGMRRQGKWSNPDVTKIAIREYPLLKKKEVILVTYELKQWGRWNTSSIYEAASHHKFSHEAYFVLEWASETPVEEGGLEEIYAICSHFGVGLITMHPYHKKYRQRILIEAPHKAPSDDYLEEYLAFMFDYFPDAGKSFAIHYG